MNKIVKEHYPVENLPEDLRVGLAQVGHVTLVIEAEPPAEGSPEGRYQALLADMATWVLDDDGEDSVQRVRALRDEWLD